jgi:hypothetical protein
VTYEYQEGIDVFFVIILHEFVQGFQLFEGLIPSIGRSATLRRWRRRLGQNGKQNWDLTVNPKPQIRHVPSRSRWECPSLRLVVRSVSP